jgi:heme exporter protein A
VPERSAGTPLLAARSLCLERGGRELFRDLSFDVYAGQLWQIEGPNGAGKTSLIRILCGLSRYGFEGSVQLESTPLYLGHLPAVKGLLTPRENLAWHVGGEDQYGDRQVESALARVGLYGFEDVPSRTLSAGQHRRVNLARLFLTASLLWILDEPFTAIDADGIDQLQTLIGAHVCAGGSVVLTSHQALQVDCEVQRLVLPQGVLP